MSIQGKKIAQINMAFEIARSIVDLHIKIRDTDGMTAYIMSETHKQACMAISSELNSTPHQYFNDQGKIDKRKVRRHDRKTSAGNKNVAGILEEHGRAIESMRRISMMSDKHGKTMHDYE